ncbi:NS38 [Marbled eel reovirus]|nr:NS38 [Marbled eel reovirus]
MASKPANLIRAENTSRVVRLLETYPSLSTTVRQDTADLGLIRTNYSASGLAAVSRLLNPLSAFKNARTPGYTRHVIDPTRPSPMRSLISAGLEPEGRHSCQIQVTPSLRQHIERTCGDRADDVLPPTTQYVTPVILASRVAMLHAGLNPADFSEIPPNPTALSIAFTTRALVYSVDVARACHGIHNGSALELLNSAGALDCMVVNYGFNLRPGMTRDGPGALSPAEFQSDTYPVDWIHLIFLLGVVQVETDIEQLAMSASDKQLVESHPEMVEPLMRRLQTFAPFSVPISRLCVQHAREPFRTLGAALRIWQRPALVVMPTITLNANGSSLEVIGDGTLLFKIGASLVGSV